MAPGVYSRTRFSCNVGQIVLLQQSVMPDAEQVKSANDVRVFRDMVHGQHTNPITPGCGKKAKNVTFVKGGRETNRAHEAINEDLRDNSTTQSRVLLQNRGEDGRNGKQRLQLHKEHGYTGHDRKELNCGSGHK